MSQHRHDWVIAQYLLLGLPNCENMMEKYVQWSCPCGVWMLCTGEFRPGTPLGTPEQWEAIAAQQQRQQTPETRQARIQRAQRIR